MLIILLVTAGGALTYLLFETEKPVVTIDKQLKYLGSKTEISLHATDRRSGLKSVVVDVEQQGQRKQVFNRTFQRQAWLAKAGPADLQESFTVDIRQSGLKNGQANLIVTVRDFSLNGVFKGNETVLRLPVIIDTVPPRVTIEHAQQYIRPGGSGIVVYTLNEPVQKHGVEIDHHFFAGYPLSGDKRFIAYIALPWNSGEPETMRVVAVDAAGNQGKSVFATRYRKIRFKKDRINVTDGFLKRKIPEFEEHYPELTGTMLEKYLFVNNTIRKQNAEQIRRICAHPLPQQFWHDKFLRMPGAGRAGFADQRTYYYQGKAIDHQTHLGMDIASTARAEIRAANSGKVIFADYLGIYGNTIIIDHGQGVFSLYSHLSQIQANVGDMVAKNDPIARSGATGMAGGDHLHFSMLVHGVFVTPKEWWDQHWIDVNINAVIGH